MRDESILAQQIRARMITEGATDLSDDTIRRCLGPTIGAGKITDMAIKLRDRGELFAPGYSSKHEHNLTKWDHCFLCGCLYYNCLCSHEG